MNREDIIKLAREAGFTDQNGFREVIVRHSNGSWIGVKDELERFAALVAAAERERIIEKNRPVIEQINVHIKELETAVAAEREACAKVCESLIPFGSEMNMQLATMEDCAAAIRARGQA